MYRYHNKSHHHYNKIYQASDQQVLHEAQIPTSEFLNKVTIHRPAASVPDRAVASYQDPRHRYKYNRTLRARLKEREHSPLQVQIPASERYRYCNNNWQNNSHP